MLSDEVVFIYINLKLFSDASCYIGISIIKFAALFFLFELGLIYMGVCFGNSTSLHVNKSHNQIRRKKHLCHFIQQTTRLNNLILDGIQIFVL